MTGKTLFRRAPQALSLAAAATVVGMASGIGWLAIVLSAVGLALCLGAGAHASRQGRAALWGGGLASLILVPVDQFLGAQRMIFFLRGTLPGVPISLVLFLARGVFLSLWLFGLEVLSTRAGRWIGTIVGPVTAGLLGWALEILGGRFWTWNATLMPNAEWGNVWALVPAQWFGAGLLGWYYLMPFSRRVPDLFLPIGIGLRTAGGWIGFWLVAFGLLLRLYGKAGLG